MTPPSLRQRASKPVAATTAGSSFGQDRPAAIAAESGLGQDRPAAVAAARVSRASLVLGGLGLASAIFVVARLLESWRVTSHAASHQISIFGQKLSYPAANVDAIVIVLLAALGLVVTARALTGAARELQASRRFHRFLSGEQPQTLHGALLIDDAQPRAFCAGLLRPRVYVSTGALALLDDAALSAVLAHERHHACRHDPLRLAAGRVLARALFFLPELGGLVARQAGAGRAERRRECRQRPARKSVRPRPRDAQLFRHTSGRWFDRGRPSPRRLPARRSTQLALSRPPVPCGHLCPRPLGCGRRARRASSQRLGHARAPLPIPSAVHPRSRRHSICVGRPRGELPSPPSAPAGTQRHATP